MGHTAGTAGAGLSQAGAFRGGGLGPAEAAGSSTRAGQGQVVFVKTAQGLDPRLVRLGLSDFDYIQVLDGVKEGDQVALLSVAELQAKREEDQSRIRQRLGSSVPGTPAPGGRGAAGGR